MRVGIHTGTPLLTDEGYVGDDVHRAARIAAAGHGGQVLISAATRILVELALADLREQRLGTRRARARFPAGKCRLWAAQDAPPNEPPDSPDTLPRTGEGLGEVLALLERDDVRLLTLTGPGGTGKTRLAVQTAAALSDRYTHGVFWVSLAPLRDSKLVLESARQVLGANDGLASLIADKRMLLLFDNFEHVVGAAPDLSALLGACPQLDLMVTSGERSTSVASRSTPSHPSMLRRASASSPRERAG